MINNNATTNIQHVFLLSKSFAGFFILKNLFIFAKILWILKKSRKFAEQYGKVGLNAHSTQYSQDFYLPFFFP